ncbi:MAG: PD-(D/E)XK nuclease family protein [Gammaproteobacteria bacterium]|nr:PD-(D/E)XK nuclease family protein [Gammaproteobacteria bacterium]MDH3405590.1 PD-(D/E)XK nuclease family protein [Gammaproteobacteria bacterium]MDH3563019.1 PD-(D/E)XK nuclease family protein [Gammaproteobacteria bacterium]
MSIVTKAKRTRNLYEPGKPFKLSRSKIENFLNCPRCFYLDRRLGIGQPSGPPFNLNSAVDHLLKKEFDVFRAEGKPHPLMQEHGIDAIPYADERLSEWRENFKGVTYHHASTNLVISGAVDDLWINPKGEVNVVDYKATSKDSEVNLDADWQISYKRQMEIYQWLLRRNGLSVSDTGYFVYCNGRRDRGAFNGKLEFAVKIIPYAGNDSWVEECIVSAHRCLSSADIPPHNPVCEFCNYRAAVREVE